MLLGWFDGGSRGNPGRAGAGWVLRDEDHVLVQCGCVFVGDNSTNNQAEYAGLVALLEAAVAHNAQHLKIFGDSLLVIQQMQGAWQIRHWSMREWHTRASKIAAHISRVEFHHVLRHLNKDADFLSNMAMDSGKTQIGTQLMPPQPPPKQRSTCTTAVRIRREHGKVVQDCDVWVGAAWTKGGWQLPRSDFCNNFYRDSPAANLDAYVNYVMNRLDLLQKIDSELRGWRLGCFCDDLEYCHAAWLAALADDPLRLREYIGKAQVELAKKSIKVCNE